MEKKTLVYSTGTGLAEVSGSGVLMTDMFTCMRKYGSLFPPSNSTIELLPSLFRQTPCAVSEQDRRGVKNLQHVSHVKKTLYFSPVLHCAKNMENLLTEMRRIRKDCMKLPPNTSHPLCFIFFSVLRHCLCLKCHTEVLMLTCMFALLGYNNAFMLFIFAK